MEILFPRIPPLSCRREAHILFPPALARIFGGGFSPSVGSEESLAPHKLAGPLYDLGYPAVQVTGIERLDQKLRYPRIPCLYHTAHLAESRHENNGHKLIGADRIVPNTAAERNTVHGAHHPVCNHDIGPVLAENPEGLVPVSGNTNICKAICFQNRFQQFEHGLIVFDNQDRDFSKIIGHGSNSRFEKGE